MVYETSNRAILFRKRRERIEAYDGELWAINGVLPKQLEIEGETFECMGFDFKRADNNFFFWDEYHDDSGATVGYSIHCVDPCRELKSLLLSAINCQCVYDDFAFDLFLSPCESPTGGSEQYFESICYQNLSTNEIVLAIIDHSQRIGFPLIRS